MELFTSLTGVVCAVTSVATFVENRNRRRKEAEDRERLIKAGLVAVGVLGIAWMLTRK